MATITKTIDLLRLPLEEGTNYIRVTSLDDDLSESPRSEPAEIKAGGFTYSLSSDGKSYSVVGIGGVITTNITIPGEYNGLPVTRIGNAAFTDTEIAEVTISANVKTIEANAFNVESLTKVTFEENSQLETIGSCAFEMSEITEFIVPANVSRIGSNAFPPTLRNLRFRSHGVSNAPSLVIDDSACADTNIVELLLPDNLVEIGENAFAGCGNLEWVSTGMGLQKIGK
jgi:hypothetical protein